MAKSESGRLERFCRAYLRTMDPERAAREAGCRDGYAQLAAERTQRPAEEITELDLGFTLSYLPLPVTPWYIELLPYIIMMVVCMAFWMLMMRQQGGGGFCQVQRRLQPDPCPKAEKHVPGHGHSHQLRLVAGGKACDPHAAGIAGAGLPAACLGRQSLRHANGAAAREHGRHARGAFLSRAGRQCRQIRYRRLGRGRPLRGQGLS